MKLTTAQKTALTNAQKHGSAWRNAAGEMQPSNASKRRMIGALVEAGLIVDTFPARITEAGRRAIA